MTEPVRICDVCHQSFPDEELTYTEDDYELCEKCLAEFEDDPEEGARRITERRQQRPTLGGKPPFPYRSE